MRVGETTAICGITIGERAGQKRAAKNAKQQLTAGICKHTHQWGQLGRAPAMGDVQPAASRTRDASGLRLLLVLLLLIHGGGWCSQAAGMAGRADRLDRWMHVECETEFGRMRLRGQQWMGIGCLVYRTGISCFGRCCVFGDLRRRCLPTNYLLKAFEPKGVNERSKRAEREWRA
jgi:hypothetical protein